MEARDELEIVRLRNDFYRDGISKIFIALSIIIAIIALLLVMSFYLHTQKPKPVVFRTDADGRAFPPVPVNVPFVKEADLVQWLNDSVSASFSLDFINYREEVAGFRKYYTDAGYTKLLALLNTYANATQIQNGKYFVSAGAGGVPLMYNEGVVNGTFTWILHMPLSLTYASAQKSNAVVLSLEVTVVRTQVNDELAGIAIDNITTIEKPAATAGG